MMKNRSKTALASVTLLCGLCFFPPACAQSLDARCSEGACDPRDAAAGDARDGGSDAPTDPCLGNPTAAECLDEKKALFVSGSKGNDQDATGSQAKPFKTIGAALAKIDAVRRRIYICGGRYAEDLSFNATHNGVSLFGGVDCAWVPAPTLKPVIGASATPVKVANTSGLGLADLAIEAKDAAKDSSIALMAFGATVALQRVRLSAGAGAAVTTRGDAGMSGVPDKPLAGNDANTPGVGALAKTCTCATSGETTTGGKGGDSGFDGQAGGITQPSPKPTAATGAGGTFVGCGQGAPVGGTRGSDAPDAPDGPGAQTAGVLTPQGWVAQAGSPGENGKPGQGGGGGGGILGGGGGGGGCGGCGGTGGGGGAAGGASIAIAAVDSVIVVERSELKTAPGGVGGQGGPGGPSIAGGLGGIRSGAGCLGGAGGTGGAGGAGGGGAGGSSAVVIYTKKKPQLDSSTEASAVIGAEAPGGAGLNPANIGTKGVRGLYLESK